MKSFYHQAKSIERNESGRRMDIARGYSEHIVMQMLLFLFYPLTLIVNDSVFSAVMESEEFRSEFDFGAI
jgi:hypothetical protein